MKDIKDLSEEELKAELELRAKQKKEAAHKEKLEHPLIAGIRAVFPNAFSNKRYRNSTSIELDANRLRKLPKEILDCLSGEEGVIYFETGHNLIESLEAFGDLKVSVEGMLDINTPYDTKKDELCLREYSLHANVDNGLTKEQLDLLSRYQGRHTYCFLGGSYLTLTDYPDL